MEFIFEANTPEELRQEVIKYLEYRADYYRQNEKMYRTKHKMELEREKAFVLQSVADDLKFAVLKNK